MAHVRGLGKVAQCGVTFTVGGGPFPDASIKLVNEAGATVTVVLNADEFRKLWVDLAQDARFRVDKRPPKPDSKLADAVDDLLSSVLKRS